MKVYLHIGPDRVVSERLQQVMDTKRGQLLQKGVLFARSPNPTNHTRLFMAVTDPDKPDLLRFKRGFVHPDKQAQLADDVLKGLMAEVGRHTPDTLILSAHQLGSFVSRRSEMERLHALLSELSTDITLVAHVEDPARMLIRHYETQLTEGRGRSLALETGLTDSADWWNQAVETQPQANPAYGMFSEIQGAAFWLDYQRLAAEWDSVFGKGATQFRAIDHDLIWSDRVTEEIRASFDIRATVGKADAAMPPLAMPAAHMTRMQQFNNLLMRLIQKDRLKVPRVLWKRLLVEIGTDGPPTMPGSLHKITDRFSKDRAALLAAHPGLTEKAMTPDAPQADWRPADPEFGFRATQYLTAFDFRLRKAAQDQEEQQSIAGTVNSQQVEDLLGPTARSLFPPLARQKFLSLRESVFAPHNRIGVPDQTQVGPAYIPAPAKDLTPGNTGNVIVGCMKNEAPYILEWVAYHRAIGIDTFVIYTNGCEDPTDPILKRLEALGLVHHRDNEGWKGKSPQQHALNNAMKDPVVRNSDWIIHIDVDEYMNIRFGNGTLTEFLDHVPDATNVAMTWRLFGHGGVARYEDQFVISQFDQCAPKFCPKPHTVWGFKTMTRNIGAYEKLSCHRPNKLQPEKAVDVSWVNGSGQEMTREVIDNGWRNSKRSIGYDLLQLNHYALRSAESFLVKRQRGRALHVDRSIGLNYWIRMDWNDIQDVSIQRNIPRVRAEYDRLMQDPELRRLHQDGVAWHRAKAAELHQMAEFEDLYDQALNMDLSATERAAYALALDVES